MRIYIDEAGPFATPQPGVSKISCVGSLILPSGSEWAVRLEYERLRAQWGSSDREVKGATLMEQQADQLIQMLVPFGPAVHVVALDLGLYSDTAKKRFRERHADAVIAALAGNCREETRELHQRMLQTSIPLTIQMYLTRALLRTTRRMAAALLQTSERPEIQWVFDAKDTRRTTYERLLPSLVLESADFAESLVYADSESEVGLQIADNVVTICRRALNGTLAESGWGDLGRLFTIEPDRPISLRQLDHGEPAAPPSKAQAASAAWHAAVIAKLSARAR